MKFLAPRHLLPVQAPKNYSRGYNNLPVAQEALNGVINRANAQYVEAINVDGVGYYRFSKVMQGYKCTCKGVNPNLTLTGTILPPADSGGSSVNDNYTIDITSEDAFVVRGKKEERTYLDRNSAKTEPTPSTNEVSDTELERTMALFEYDQDDTNFEDLLNPNAPLGASLINSTVPFAATETRCGICLGTGYTNGYNLSSGTRIILDASGQYLFNSSGFTLDKTKAPYAFTGTADSTSFVEWSFELPAFFDSGLFANIRNNIEMASNLKLEYVTGNESVYHALNTDVLSDMINIQNNRIRVRVSPITPNGDKVSFTHVELGLLFSAIQKMQMSPLSDQLNMSQFDSIVTTSVVLPPTEQNVRPQDIIYETKYDQLWKVISVTDFKTARAEVMGWQVDLRAILNYESAQVLRVIRNQHINKAFGRLEGANMFTLSPDNYSPLTPRATLAKSTAALVQALELTPIDGEYALDPSLVYKGTQSVNAHVSGVSNMEAAIEDIKRTYPNCKTLWFTPTWFASSLSADSLEIRPKLDPDSFMQEGSSPWAVSSTTRVNGQVCTNDANYKGTISDASLIRAILFAKRNGFNIGIKPLIKPDLLNRPGADLITFPSNTTGTFFSIANDQMFLVDSTNPNATAINYIGPADNSYTRFLWHYAVIAKLLNVNYFSIGSCLTGVTANANARLSLIALASQIKTYASDVKLTYEASIFEYGAKTTQTDVSFPMDPLWNALDFISIKYDASMSDWKDGGIDAAKYQTIYNADYLKSQIEGGENFDFFYPSPAARQSQTRTPLPSDWRYKPKAITAWKTNSHTTKVAGMDSANSPFNKDKPVCFFFSVAATDKATNDLKAAIAPHALTQSDTNLQICAVNAFLAYWTNKTSYLSGGFNLASPVLGAFDISFNAANGAFQTNSPRNVNNNF